MGGIQTNNAYQADFEQLVSEMAESDCAGAKRDNLVRQAGLQALALEYDE